MAFSLDPAFDGAGDADADAHDFEGSERALEPEQQLFLAVLLQCWEDAFEESDARLAGGLSAPAMVDSADEIRAEARRWLTSDLDPWREDRETVCDWVGIDPDALRDAAKAKIAGQPSRASLYVARMLGALVEQRRDSRRYNTERMLDLLADIEADAA